MTKPIRVLVIDDSAYNRRTIIKILNAIRGVEVLDYACDGEEGLRKVFDLKPDLITLDLEMPKIDGFSFLRILMANCPTPTIVVSSKSGDQDVFKALELGAVEFVAKPSARVSPELLAIEEDLAAKVSAIARTDMKKILQRTGFEDRGGFGREKSSSSGFLKEGQGKLQVVVIGSSTGGPPALQTIFGSLPQFLPVAFAIAQHMPPGFTKAFAERLDRNSPLEIKEAANGDRLVPGRVLIAPGGKNLVLKRRGEEVLALVEDPEAGQRNIPSVDVLFRSAAEVFGASALAVVLTGMGNDGARGAEVIKAKGGQILAESEESSVVFGMPKEAIATGKVDRVLALPFIGAEIGRRCTT